MFEGRRSVARHAGGCRTGRSSAGSSHATPKPLYDDFPEFAFWWLETEGAHYIGGFGRIIDLQPAEILVATEGARDLLAAEPGIIEHMHAEHADTVRLYATRRAGAPEDFWRVSGIGP